MMHCAVANPKLHKDRSVDPTVTDTPIPDSNIGFLFIIIVIYLIISLCHPSSLSVYSKLKVL